MPLASGTIVSGCNSNSRGAGYGGPEFGQVAMQVFAARGVLGSRLPLLEKGPIALNPFGAGLSVPMLPGRMLYDSGRANYSTVLSVSIGENSACQGRRAYG